MSTDPKKQILLNEDILPRGPRQEFTPATIVEDTANRVVIDAELEHPGYLYLADNWHPGWHADVDGAAQPVLRANYAFRAVALLPGKHRVTFRFEPPGLRIGLAITLTTLAVMAATGTVVAIKRRRTRRGTLA